MATTNTIAAIPTTYAGTRFRSRLEARWAAFFDLLGWSWEYEPIDLSGYIPDFLLMFDHAPLLVEVKPIVDIKQRDAFRDAHRKVATSGWGGEALIVGCGPLLEGREGVTIVEVGRFAFEHDADGQPIPSDGDLNEATAMVCAKCSGVSVWSPIMSWHCRRCGSWEGRHHIHEHTFRGQLANVLRGRWREAGNRVQWRAG